MRADHLAKTLRTVLSGVYAIALVPACLLALGAGMALGGPNVQWDAWMLFAFAGLVGPAALFFAMIKTWPWSEGDDEPTSAKRIIAATGIAMGSYLFVWLVLDL